MKYSVIICLFALKVAGALFADSEKPNVLFIAIDDLRPDFGCYGYPDVQSPNIDRLAQEGVLFERAYCQQAVCGPSRLSMMTSNYPDSLGIWGMSGRNIIEWRDTRKGVTSLPEHFRKHGYKAIGFGKIYDSRLGLDLEESWDHYERGWKGAYAASDSSDEQKKAKNQTVLKDKKSGRPNVRPAVQTPDVSDDELSDGNVAKLALQTIGSHDFSQPLFLAVGFQKPHLPFVAPKRYWDLYDREKLALSEQRVAPEGFSKYLFSWYKEIESYDVPVPMTTEVERELVHGYHACVSYVDAQVGKLVDALKRKGIYENTIIVLWGDHGFKLGEFGEWAKCTNLESDARVPLIFRYPEQVTHGAETKSLVELVDVFPTLCELAGISIPESVEGRSLVPVLETPDKDVREFALTQYPLVQQTMTYSIRTDRWRFHETREDETGKIMGVELYDLSQNLVEQKNVAANYPDVVKELANLLDDHIQKAKKWTGGNTISAW